MVCGLCQTDPWGWNPFKIEMNFFFHGKTFKILCLGFFLSSELLIPVSQVVAIFLMSPTSGKYARTCCAHCWQEFRPIVHCFRRKMNFLWPFSHDVCTYQEVEFSARKGCAVNLRGWDCTCMSVLCAISRWLAVACHAQVPRDPGRGRVTSGCDMRNKWQLEGNRQPFFPVVTHLPFVEMNRTSVIHRQMSCSLLPPMLWRTFWSPARHFPQLMTGNYYALCRTFSSAGHQ